MDKFWKNLSGWIIYLAILAGLIYGVPRGLVYILKTPYPMASITSGSMWPELKRGDLVFIKGINSKDEVQLGDIIVYKNQVGFTIHRIVKINGDTVITKGDANNVFDSPVKYGEIIGKALIFNQKPFRIPMLGNVSILLNKVKI